MERLRRLYVGGLKNIRFIKTEKNYLCTNMAKTTGTRKRYARRVIKKSSIMAAVKRLIPKPDLRKVTFGLSATNVGTQAGILGTGSMAFNDYLMNSGAHIATGTGTQNRLGNKIRLQYLDVDLFMLLAASNACRIIIGKNRHTSELANQTSNTNLTAVIESPSGGVLADKDYGALPIGQKYHFATSEVKGFTILKDIKLVGQEPAASSTYFPVRMRVPLNLDRVYNTQNTVETGDWFIYVVSTGGTCDVSGTIKLVWTDQ